MPNMAVGQRVLVTAVGEYLGQRTMTTWLYRVSSVAGSITDVAMADALHTAFTNGTGLLTKYRACCAGDGAWTGVATWYQVVGPVRYRKIQRSLGDGTGLLSSGTANIQGSITRYGEFGLRSAIGGIRVPISSLEVSDGKLSPEVTALMQALADEMEETQAVGSPLVTLIPQVGVPGYTNATPPERIPVTNSSDLAECVVQDTARVLRRRTLRLGI